MRLAHRGKGEAQSQVWLYAHQYCHASITLDKGPTAQRHGGGRSSGREHLERRR